MTDRIKSRIIALVLAEIDLGRVLCSIARTSNISGDRVKNLEMARKAYNNAIKCIFTLKVGHVNFSAVRAKADRLRFELQRLKA